MSYYGHYQGYTAADLEIDCKEIADRMNSLGCFSCGLFGDQGLVQPHVCNPVIEGNLPKCPHFRKGGMT